MDDKKPKSILRYPQGSKGYFVHEIMECKEAHGDSMSFDTKKAEELKK